MVVAKKCWYFYGILDENYFAGIVVAPALSSEDRKRREFSNGRAGL